VLSRHRGFLSNFVYSEYFDLVVDAVAAECKIMAGRAKKEALIKGDRRLIQALARRRGGKARDLS
jgi:hypothetical protein